jgi:hypothetical protein
MAYSGDVNIGSVPGTFPNDSNMRGKDRRLRRELPASDGNPRQVNHGPRKVVSVGITPEGLKPSATLTGAAGKFGLNVNDGMGPG